MSCSEVKRPLSRTNYVWLRCGINMPLKEENPTLWLVHCAFVATFQGIASDIASKKLNKDEV